MSRLYQEIDGTAFRDLQPKQFLEKVIKIIPSEVIAGYLCLTGALPAFGSPSSTNILKWAIFLVLLFVIPLYYKSISNGHPFIKHAALSMVAFLLWSYSISGATLTGDEYYDPAIASLSLMIFTVLCPYVKLDK